jgi:uncharacterized membrane protein
MTFLVALHVLAATIWVGGMFFAYLVLRPAAAGLEPPQRLALWARIFGKFFYWVWLAVILLPLTGYAMIFGWFGGMQNVSVHVHAMQLLGWIMTLAYLHLFFAPYRRLQRAVTAADWSAAGTQLAQIRWIVLFNLTLGLAVVAIAAGGRYWY